MTLRLLIVMLASVVFFAFQGCSKNSDDSGNQIDSTEKIRIEKEISTRNAKARTLVINKKYDEALDLINQSLKQNSSDPLTLNLQGTVFFHTGKFDKARDSYEKALRQYSETDAEYVECAYNLGLVWRKLGNNSKAIEQYEKVLKIDTTYHKALNNIAWIFAQGNSELDRALNKIDKAISLAPREVDYWDTKATILVKQGKIEDAIKCLDIAISQAPERDDLKIHKQQIQFKKP